MDGLACQGANRGHHTHRSVFLSPGGLASSASALFGNRQMSQQRLAGEIWKTLIRRGVADSGIRNRKAKPNPELPPAFSFRGHSPTTLPKQLANHPPFAMPTLLRSCRSGLCRGRRLGRAHPSAVLEHKLRTSSPARPRTRTMPAALSADCEFLGPCDPDLQRSAVPPHRRRFRGRPVPARIAARMNALWLENPPLFVAASIRLLSTAVRNYGDVFWGSCGGGRALALRRCISLARSARVKVQRKGVADFS